MSLMSCRLKAGSPDRARGGTSAPAGTTLPDACPCERLRTRTTILVLYDNDNVCDVVLVNLLRRSLMMIRRMTMAMIKVMVMMMITVMTKGNDDGDIWWTS